MKKITVSIINIMYKMMHVFLFAAIWLIFFILAVADGYTLSSAAIVALKLGFPISTGFTILWLLMRLGDWIIDNK